MFRLVGALQGWAARYPGDMVDSPTQVVFRTTVNYMIKYPFLGHITGDLVTIEQALDQTLDIDLSWSCQPPEPRPATPETAVPSEEKPAKADEEEQLEDTANGPPLELEPQPVGTPSLESGDQLAEPRKPRPISSDRTSASSSDVSRSVYSGDSMGHQRWASAISSVLQMDAHVFSLELTRMQWELFAAIRPRDILRHDLGKERGDPVARSIEFFNHVSRWVSTMILASPKPKTRAKVYEAFVKVAHQLRRLNNYDSLCAVISGLSEVSVVRLAQTRALVKLEPALVRDYQSHLKLMDTRLGHQLYRRALQADNTYGHTAIPLL
jgi:hypothetical protein